MKLRKNKLSIENPEPRSLSEVLKDIHELVDVLRDKLKHKNNVVMDLRKEIDRLSEERDNLLIVNKSHKELNGKLQETINNFSRGIDRSIDDL
tara:strand:- start:1681 stop:1959 length:279 start_codon:yes stop_codon:yes gene_type:complete